MGKRDGVTGGIKNRIGPKKWKSIRYFCMAVPFLIFITAFCYVPLLGWIYAVFDYKQGMLFYQLDKMEFVGLRYFARFFTDRQLPRVLRNTLVMSVGGLLLSPLPVLTAILINDIKNVRVKKFIQTTTTFPNFISWVIVFGLATALFSANGMWNQLLSAIGLKPSQFGILGDRKNVWWFQLALQQWKGLGWSCIIYLAAITGIDTELYDAAMVDGANKGQRIWHITIPGVAPTFFVLLLMSISNILSNGFEQYYMFINPLVADKIEVLDYYIYKVGIQSGKYSYGIAVGMVKTLVGICLLFAANGFSKKVRGDSLI